MEDRRGTRTSRRTNSSESRHEHWELLTEMGFIEVPMVLPSEEEYDDHTLLRRKLAK
jgi:hypothetical protein